MVPALTPCTVVSSRLRLASYPSMTLSSWIPCSSAETQGLELENHMGVDGLYFAELLRRRRYLAQFRQARVDERMREDVYVSRHYDCFCLTGKGQRRDT
jgi:hypothetical protein